MLLLGSPSATRVFSTHQDYFGLPACPSQPQGWGGGQLSHFFLPDVLALLSVSRLGRPSSVEEVVSSAWPQRAISPCSAMDELRAVSQVFMSS